ncbi:DUF3108 domain-containing protein [Celeribacter sp. SCSIO 80788]|uniref:DUF3108 domain-containing protein n=1 Tax=Celeribacter sp. SCSIO 80788 TaxID=3117013 RepID=UPI003DA5CD15
MALRLLLPLLLLAQPLFAADRQMRYDIHLGALKVGQLGLAADETARDYAVTARFRDAGLMAALVNIRFAATVQGKVQDTRFRPLRYEEDIDTGRRQSRVRLAYDNGHPQVVTYEPSAPLLIRLADQHGTLDPLSVLYTLLRDSPQPCATTLNLFDGRRRSAVTLSEMQDLTCQGRYSRIAGFSAEEMAERRTFPFTLHYARQDGTYRLIAAEIETLWGTARLTPR